MNQSNQKSTNTTQPNKLRQPQIIAVTSGKGGVGKTNFSVNTALLLAKLNQKVLIIDADIHLGNVDVMFGISPDYTLVDVLKGNKSLKEIIKKTPYGVDFLPATSGIMDMIEGEDNIVRSIAQAFNTFQNDYDIILIDTGAGVSISTLSFVLGTEKIIVVVTPDPSSISDAYAMIKIINQNQDNAQIMMIANKVRNDEAGESLFYKMNLIVNKFLNTSLIFGGSIMEDNQVLASVHAQQPVVIRYPRSRAVINMQLICRRILKLPVRQSIQKNGNYFDRVRERLSNLDLEGKSA
ncbi:MAG: MinD/ParA family protein [Candidatus Marinimicrobia bacterium]|nr:MinD/ParA family protein [Candidatus Neomarinimicrobiota bacterium]